MPRRRRQGTQNHSQDKLKVDDGNSVDTVELDPTRICSAPRDSTRAEFRPYQVALIHGQRVRTPRNPSKSKKHVRAPGASLLPLSGVSVHAFSCITMFTPFTTVGVRVIAHV